MTVTLASRENRTPLRTTPVGVTGTSIVAGFILDVDQNPEVRSENWYGSPGQIGLSQKMMRDAHVRSGFNSVKDPILQADWAADPGGSRPIDIEAADLVEWALFEQLNWHTGLESLLWYIRDGFAFVEPTDDVVEIPIDRFPLHPGKGYGVAPTGFHHRPAYSVYRWGQDDVFTDRMAWLEQWVPGSDAEAPGVVRIPASHLIRLSWEQEGANFAGFAPQRSAYGSWKAKLLLMVMEMIAHERSHVPTPILNLPDNNDANPDDIADAQEILKAMRSHEMGYLILPNGIKFEWAANKGTTNIGETIERLNRDIAFLYNNQHMLLGSSGQGTGSYALSGTQQSTQQISLEKHAAFIASALTNGCDGWSYVDRLLKLNYGDLRPARPKVVVRNMPTRDWKEYLTVLPQLRQADLLRGDEPTEAFIRSVMRFPQADPKTTRKIEAPAAAAALKPAKDPRQVTE